MSALERLVCGLGGRTVVVNRLGDGRHIGTAGPFETEGKRGQRCFFPVNLKE